jgi:FKBP-type peptidyl-prolyl cis-trans isomerase (trigger factor)
MTTNNSDLSRQKDKSFTLKLTLPKKDINDTRQKILADIQKDFQKDGFRKGNVPLAIIQESISASQLIEEVASRLLSQIYSQKVKEYDLKPILSPKIKFLTPPENFDQDWVVELTSCEMPQVDLKPDFQKEISQFNKSQKSESKDAKTKKPEEVKANSIFDILVKHSHVDLPPVLLENELQHRLSRLIDQTSQAGLTVEQYLQTKNLTLEKYQQMLTSQVNEEWQINLAINKIAQEQKIEITPQEAKDFVQKNPRLGGNADMAHFLLTQQKVLDYLKTL